MFATRRGLVHHMTGKNGWDTDGQYVIADRNSNNGVHYYFHYHALDIGRVHDQDYFHDYAN